MNDDRVDTTSQLTVAPFGKAFSRLIYHISYLRQVDNDRGSIIKTSAFGKADYFAVNYPIDDDLPRFDCYLDDIFGAFNPRDADRSAAAIPLALHLVVRPCDPEVAESFPRDDILAIPKFLAEAKPSETKMILGWCWIGRRLAALHRTSTASR